MIMYARHLSSSHEATFLKLELCFLEILTLLIKCAESFRCKLFIMDNDDYRDICEIWKGWLQSRPIIPHLKSCFLLTTKITMSGQGGQDALDISWPPILLLASEVGGQNMPERFLVSLLPAGTPDPKAKGTLVIIHHKTQDNRYSVQGLVITPSSCMS